MLEVFDSIVADAKVVNDKGKLCVLCFVLPQGGDAGNRFIPVRFQVVNEAAIGNASGQPSLIRGSSC